MDQASEDKVLSLQLQDVQALLDQENAADEEGEISDQRYALETYQKHFRQRHTSLQDARMARNFAAAVQSDEHILGDVYEEEQVAFNDRMVAQQLTGVVQPEGPAESYRRINLDDDELANLGQFNRTESMLPGSTISVTSVNTVCVVREHRGTKREREVAADEEDGSRSKRSKGQVTHPTVAQGSKRKRSSSPRRQIETSSLATSVHLNPGNAEEANNSVASKKRVRTSTLDERATEEQIVCISCSEPDVGTYLSLGTCEHRYCNECTVRWVESALEPGSAFPPVCCGHQITLEELETRLSVALARCFKEQEQAIAALACPLVCAEPGCLVGIPAQDIVDDKGQCLACRRFTCNKCRMGWHEDEECVVDKERALVMELAKREGWQSCHGCGNLVELNIGCYHMTCRCKASFCYLCGLKWHECLNNCQMFDEERLLNHVERVTDRRVAIRARSGRSPDTRARADQVAEVRAILRQDCDHGLWEYLEAEIVTAQGLGNCQFCGFDGWVYLLRCEHCRMMSCRFCSTYAPPRAVRSPKSPSQE